MVGPYLDGFLCHGLAVNPPLWFESWLDDVLASGAQWDLHFVWLDLDDQSFFFESRCDRVSGVESLHALQTAVLQITRYTKKLRETRRLRNLQ